MADQTEFQKRLQLIGVNGMISAAIALGNRLHLFEALADVGSEESPATPGQVAEASGCKERYVKEWLSVMALSDIIVVNEEEKFWIRKENTADLKSGVPLQLNQFLPVLLGAYDKVCDVFRKDGPLGLNYSDFKHFYEVTASISEAVHKTHLISDFIPALGADITERLEKGGMMFLDVGCGNGFHAALLAETFPKSNFTGIDISLEAVHSANQQRKDNGKMFDNLAFIQMNAGEMDEDWTEKQGENRVEYVVAESLKEIHRVLKKGGIFGMLEVKGTSNVFTDRKELGLLAAMPYTCSMFHCLPVGSNSPDALGLGTMFGEKRATKLLQEAGFTDINVIHIPQFAMHLLYLCKKH